VNTSRQIGGAIGLAAMSAIAASSTSSFAGSHPAVTAASGLALDHGFRTAIWTMMGILLFAAILVGALLAPSREETEPQEEHVVLKEAA
jgi:glucose uptake protein GlcU